MVSKYLPFCLSILSIEQRQKGRLAGFKLYVSFTDVSNTASIQSTTLCYKDGPKLPPLNFTTTCMMYGRYVIFYNERLDGVSYPIGYELVNSVVMEICELTVQGKHVKNVHNYMFTVFCL